MNGKITINSKSVQEIHSYNWSENDNRAHKYTSIVVLTYNKLEYTKLCIESIRKFTKAGCYEIIVVDNASTDGTRKWLLEQDDLVTILNDENKGFPGGCNQGIEIARGESVLLLNNDIIVSPNWLFNLNNALWSDEDVGAVGSCTNSISNLQAIYVTYNSIKQMIDFARIQNDPQNVDFERRVKLVGFSMLIKKSVIDEVGLLDERFFPGNYEDDDLSYRIILSGKKCLFCKSSFVHHFGSVSFESGSSKFKAILDNNRQKFKEKWNFNSDYSSNIRLELIDMMEVPNPLQSINVLEIGCGCGGSLLMLKSKYKNANIFGLEIDEMTGRIASKSFPTIVANIETADLPYHKSFFDYILIGDVLEHLVDPDETLKKLHPLLKSGGRIIASIPNIMHISVVEELLQGNFTYSDAGILDRTHLRFFTLYEIAKMFIRCNYQIGKKLTTNIDISKSQQELIKLLSSRYGEDKKFQYAAYQYVVEAKKISSEGEIDFKYLIMRIDNNIDLDKSIEEVAKYYESNTEDFKYQLEMVMEQNIVNKGDVYNKIAVGLFAHNQIVAAEDMFLKSYEINPDNPDTVFNLCYIKAQNSDYDSAYEIIMNFNSKHELTEDFKELKEVIEQNLKVGEWHE